MSDDRVLEPGVGPRFGHAGVVGCDDAARDVAFAMLAGYAAATETGVRQP
ncbi:MULTISPECIES: hypothetical protein [unclassified Nonomuraea]